MAAGIEENAQFISKPTPSGEQFASGPMPSHAFNPNGLVSAAIDEAIGVDRGTDEIARTASDGGVSKSPIIGYRDLSPFDVALMNRGKLLANQVGDFITELELVPGVDRRWLAIGKTDLQTGFMAVLRGIARPTSF